MTSDLDVLRELINEDALVRLDGSDHEGRVAVLEEVTDSGRIQYSIKITKVPDNAVVIKADAFPAPRRIFRCQRGECKRGDYIIMASFRNKSYVVYVEMKKGKGDSDVVHQLKGSECFVSYCQAIAGRFWSRPNFLGPCESRFVSITKIGISRFGTRERRQADLHDEPERMLKIDYIRDGGELPFIRLIKN